jgi:tetratricopeptide (TPR) repeat protein
LYRAATISGDFLRDDDRNTLLLAIRARTLVEKGDLEQALKHLQKSLQLDPDNRSVMSIYKAFVVFFPLFSLSLSLYWLLIERNNID